ncbi:hypothetical protein LC605_26480 [Nostoc sp. CHAB 5836]|nr:hypothetical protein [Nostoc sp. CHAB 5836]
MVVKYVGVIKVNWLRLSLVICHWSFVICHLSLVLSEVEVLVIGHLY